MSDIKFYDFEFNLLHTEPRFISSRWNLKYNDVGTFEAHFPLESDVLKVALNNRYIVIEQDGNTAVYIGPDVSTELVVYGRTCNWLLSKKVTKPCSIDGTFDKVVYDLLAKSFGSAVSKGIYPSSADFFSFKEDKSLLTSDAVKKCLDTKKCGQQLRFEPREKKWYFDIIAGKEKNVLLSEANRNAYDTKLNYDLLDYANCGYYEYESTSEAGKLIQTFVSNWDSEPDTMKKWEALFSADTVDEAKQELETKVDKNQSGCSVRGLNFGNDYGLGDIVRMQIVKGSYAVTLKRRIAEMELRYEGSGGVRTETPSFEEI